MRTSTWPALCALLLATAACSDPPVHTAADRANAPLTTTLSGQVVYAGDARGSAVVLLYPAANPPPPAGTGHPLAFAQISGAALFQGALHDPSQPGPFAAGFTFPTVAPGTYLLAAFLDTDACLIQPSSTCQLSDFNPFYSVTREPNGGDLLGGHVDAHGALRPVIVPEPDVSGRLAAVTGVNLGIGATPLPDRPAFSVQVQPPQGDGGSAAINLQEPTFFSIQASPQDAEPVREPAPVFLVKYVDANGDGVPDLSPLGVPDLWPKVLIRKIEDPGSASAPQVVLAGLRDENDLNDDGVLDPTGHSYDHAVSLDGGAPQLIPADAAPDLVVLPTAYTASPITDPRTAFVPAQLYAQLSLPDGGPNVDAVVPMTSLPLAVLPEAVDASTAPPVPLTALPPGRYAVIVEQYTGQTWRSPNELAPAVAPALGLAPAASQGFTFNVAP